MLIKGNDVIGLKIISTDSGKEIGEVNDVVYNPDESRMSGLLLDGSLFSKAKILPITNIKAIGKDAVLIDSENALKEVSSMSKSIQTIVEGNIYLTGNKVITESGKEVGKISDIYFDPKTGRVEEFEVSQGNIKDISTGKKRIKFSDIITLGKDAIIVKGYTESKFAEQEKLELK